MPTRQNVRQQPSRPLVVLVVEDEAFVRMIAAETIADAGYVAIEAANADEALSLLEERQDIDIIFSDIKMPGSIDGLGLAAAAGHRWPNKPIILTSGHLRRGDAELPASATFLQKPYPAALLLTELSRLDHP